MRIMRVFITLLLMATPGAHAADMPADVASLVAAERAFAQMSVTVSMRDAFLANLAEDAVLFNPGPVNGPALYRDRVPSDVLLSWEPVYAEVAASGDYGFTTGPWEFSPDRASEPAAFGHFVSVWKKDADGAWKVALDVGIDHDPLESEPALTFRASDDPRPWPLDARGLDAARTELLEADRAFARDFASSERGAYAASAAADLRLYRKGRVPAVGRESALAEIPPAAGGIMQPTASDVAASGDLGYTIGSKGSPVTAWYLRIWRVDESGRWRIALDLDHPVPAEEP